jgi:hypothetical protein
MRPLRVVANATAVGALAILAFPAFLVLRSTGSRLFEPQPFDFALLGASAFAITLGAQVAPWRSRRFITGLAIVTTGFLMFGFLAAFSIGLPFLPAGIVLLLVLYRRLRLDQVGAGRTAAALGGAAIGFALPILYVALSVPATVECRANGGGTSAPRWGATSGAVTSVGRVDTSGNSSGEIVYGDQVVTYRCEGARLVEFQRVSR